MEKTWNLRGKKVGEGNEGEKLRGRKLIEREREERVCWKE